MTEPIVIKVKIVCPVCHKKGNIEVDKEIINQCEGGITAVHINANSICAHSFLTYLDKNLAIRDVFAYDFTVELPQMAIEGLDSTSDKENFDLDIIKYNLLPSLLGNVIKGILHKSKIIIIHDLNFLFEIFSRFFSYILEESFKSDVSFITRAEYKQNKKKYKEFLVFDGISVVNDQQKLIDWKKKKIENSIIQKFFAERDNQSSLIILKNEIFKLYALSLDLIKFNDNLKNNNNFSSKIAINYLNDKYNTKIPYDYLALLIEIVQNYFELKLKIPSISADVLELI